MSDIYLYASPKDIVPGSTGTNDIVILDPDLRIPPRHVVGNDGRLRHHTPAEMHIPGVKFAKSKRRGKDELLSEQYVQKVLDDSIQELEQRAQEDLERRKGRQTELAKWRLKKIMAGKPVPEADHELDMKTAIIESNRIKKEWRLGWEDEQALHMKIKMAKLRSRQKK